MSPFANSTKCATRSVQNTNENGALVTVGVLTRDSMHTLRRTLSSFESQTLQLAKWQIIFIDHSSEDGTRQLIENYVARRPGSTLIAHAPNDVARSRQRIVELAATDWVAFVDSDVILPDNWLESSLRLAIRASSESPRFGGLAGPLILRPQNDALNSLPRMQQSALGHFFTEQMSPASAKRSASHLPTSAALFKRATLVESGGFNVALGNCGEDLEIGVRLFGQGVVFHVYPGLACEHLLSCRSKLAWARRAFRFGQARVRVARIHRRLWFGHLILLPLGFALVRVALLALIVFIQTRAFAVVSLATISVLHLGTLAVSCRQAAALTWLTHESYAWGEFYEMVRGSIQGAAQSGIAARCRRIFRRTNRLETVALPRA